jgi:hypothetical protein
MDSGFDAAHRPGMTTGNFSKAMSGPAGRVRPWGGTHEKEPFMAKLIFVNLPVSDLDRADAFYQAIGAVKNEQFSDATAAWCFPTPSTRCS